MDISPKLDQINQRILYELDHNSRISLADLSRKLKLGRDRIKYRIDRLADQKLITKYTTSVNPYKFGLMVHKTYLRLENNPKRIAALIQFLNKHPRIYWVAACTGLWDLMFATFARTPKEFHTIQENILAQFSDILVRFSVYTIVDSWYFRKNYLLGYGSEYFSIGGEPDNLALDKIDFNLLEQLSQNSRYSNKELAEILGVTPIMVTYRIKKLESLGIIVGYRIEIDREKIGMKLFKSQLEFQTFDPHLESQLLEFCKMQPHITYYVRQIGDRTTELELEVTDYEQYSQIMDEMRQRFSKFIRNVETILIRLEYFKSMPFDLVKGPGA